MTKMEKSATLVLRWLIFTGSVTNINWVWLGKILANGIRFATPEFYTYGSLFKPLTM